MFTQKFIKIFHLVQEIGLFSRFLNLNLGNASANPKWNFTISWATSCQYHCVCKKLSKYSKRFKSYRHFSRTDRRQNFHKQAGVKIFTVRWQNQMFDYRALLEIQFSVDFLRVVLFAITNRGSVLQYFMFRTRHSTLAFRKFSVEILYVYILYELISSIHVREWKPFAFSTCNTCR